MNSRIAFFALVLVACGSALLIILAVAHNTTELPLSTVHHTLNPLDTETNRDVLTNASSPNTIDTVTAPIVPFASRITKKHFGQFITPDTSPVQPERFSGYHTGVDLETTDAEQNSDVPAYAIANGTIIYRSTVNGYGGVVIIQHDIGGETVTALYGHVRLSSVSKTVGDTVEKGEQIALLGTGGSSETDGERKHLHFGILKDESTNLRGYVSSVDDLQPWIDPELWLEEHAALP